MTATPIPPPTRLTALLAGRIVPFGPDGQASAIDKRPVPARVMVGASGLAGDQQADARVHGGLDKAIHHYPFDHYGAWRAELPERAGHFEAPGAFGENFSTLGLTEDCVCIGDIFRVGGALLQVAQARRPCWKLNVRFAVADMSARVEASGRTGWYYRVLEAGEVGVGDRVELIERRHPEWSLALLWQLLQRDGTDAATLARLAVLDALPENWRARAAKRLAGGAGEDARDRLTGPGLKP